MTIVSLKCFQGRVVFILSQVLNLRLAASLQTTLPAEHRPRITGLQIPGCTPDTSPLFEGLNVAQGAEAVRILVRLGWSLALILVQNHLLKILHPFLLCHKKFLGPAQTS